MGLRGKRTTWMIVLSGVAALSGLYTCLVGLASHRRYVPSSERSLYQITPILPSREDLTLVETSSRSMEELSDFQSALEERRRELSHLQAVSYRPLPLNVDDCSDFLAQQNQDNGGNQQNQFRSESVDQSAGLTRRANQTEQLREVVELTENCSHYMLQQGFLFASVSAQELAFPLAFSVMAYKDLPQVIRLLRAVYRPHNVYCVHFDRKSDVHIRSAIRMVVNCLPNVFMLDKSIAVKWGTESVLRPEVECMKRLLQHNTVWKYFINLTGQEFPLKTNKEMVQILTALRGANDITGTHRRIYYFRWKPKRSVPYNLTISKGAVHVLASRGFVHYTVHSPVAQQIYQRLRRSFIPDESFFSTLNHNPRLGVPGSYLGPIKMENKTTFRSFKIWSFVKGTKCAGRYVRTVCHFGVGDLSRLISSPNLIANKFSYHFQPQAYDCMESWYFNKVRQENQGLQPTMNVSLYQNSDLVKFKYSGPVLIWK